jgi:hypothetical protein
LFLWSKRILARTKSLSEAARAVSTVSACDHVNVLLFVVASNVCWQAIDLSHNEESVPGDHEGGEVPQPSRHIDRRPRHDERRS